LCRAPRWPLFPPPRRYAVPWTVLETVLVVLLYFLVQMICASLVGLSTAAPDSEQGPRLLVLMLCSNASVTLATLVMPRLMSDTRVYQLGLSGFRWRHNIVLGYFTWLFAQPVILGVFWFVSLSSPRVPHPVEKIFMSGPGWEVWLLIIATTVIAAPIAEELVLRGLVQPCMMRTPLVSDLVVAGAAVVNLWKVSGDILEKGTISEYWPALYLVALGPCYFALEWLTRRSWPDGSALLRGIMATSVLFAMLHPGPTQPALFVLALVLGWLRHRTRSVIGPIVAHFLVNLTAILQAALPLMGAW
jgi:membrane protease YdiL (CAAX protease family)